MPQNYKLKIAYDGTRYSGWEHQPGRETVQGKIEQVLARMCSLKMSERDFMKSDAPIKVIGAGRTDAGVHARAMIANVVLNTPGYEPGPWERKDSANRATASSAVSVDQQTKKRDDEEDNSRRHQKNQSVNPPVFRSTVRRKRRMTCDEIRDYMNHYLPDDIAIIDVREASDRFHARYLATGKTYQYTVFDGPVRPVFNRKYYTYCDQELDVEAMQKAAEYLVGEHDFKSFCGNSHMKKSTVRTVDSITIRRSKGYVYFTYHGSGFLQNMVRILTGTLMEVGLHKTEPAHVQEVLEAMDRSVAGPTAPAKGLCLIKVDYD